MKNYEITFKPAEELVPHTVLWHPDQEIYIRNANKQVIYQGSIAKTEELLGLTLPPLPSPANEAKLFIGQFFVYHGPSGRLENLEEWAGFNIILDNLTELLAHSQWYYDKCNETEEPIEAEEGD